MTSRRKTMEVQMGLGMVRQMEEVTAGELCCNSLSLHTCRYGMVERRRVGVGIMSFWGELFSE